MVWSGMVWFTKIYWPTLTIMCAPDSLLAGPQMTSDKLLLSMQRRQLQSWNALGKAKADERWVPANVLKQLPDVV